MVLPFEGKAGLILPNQLRTLDRQRLMRRLGSMEQDAARDIGAAAQYVRGVSGEAVWLASQK